MYVSEKGLARDYGGARANFNAQLLDAYSVEIKAEDSPILHTLKSKNLEPLE